MPLPILVSRNGRLIPPAEAQVSVFNPALYGAYGVYESFQVVAGQAFALAAHLERLEHSAAQINLPLPASLESIERWIAEILAANQAGDCVLRLFVLGPENGGEPTVFIWPQPAPAYPDSFYTHGAAVISFQGERALPTAKTLNTLVSFLAQRQAQAVGAHEALLYHGGHLTEGSNSNLFAVLNGEIVTPPAEMVLAGVARAMVLTLAASHRIPSREAPLALAGIAQWSECFITSTSRHVMPVTSVDGRPVANGGVGTLTRRMMDLFEAHFRQAVSLESSCCG